MSLIGKVRVFWLLSASGRSTLIEAMTLPIVIPLGFRILGVPRTQGLLRRWALSGKMPATGKKPGVRDACRAQKIIRRTTGIGGNCLIRSLTLWTMLLRRGISTDLRVGFRKQDGRIEGHAWVEMDDSPLNETIAETRTFVPYGQPVSFDLWQRASRNQGAGVFRKG